MTYGMLYLADISRVLERAWSSGVKSMMITGTSLKESEEALQLARPRSNLFVTVGCHPTCGHDMFKESVDSYLQQLKDLIESNRDKVVAVGECGLDYDRLHFCPKEVQWKAFRYQLDLAYQVDLPLFLHLRNASNDFIKMLRELPPTQRSRLRGVVHSFDDSLETMKTLTDEFGLYIGINGCSLKTQENMEVAKAIPVDRLCLETDAPWCELRPSHASASYLKEQRVPFTSVKKEKFQEGFMVKGRNEPCTIRNILAVLASAKNMDEQLLSETILKNTLKVYPGLELLDEC